jgi:hypothetical protein
MIYSHQIFICLALGLFLTEFSISNSKVTAEKPNAIILEDETTFEIIKSNRAKHTVHRVIKVMNAEGKEFGKIPIQESSFYKLKKFSGAVRDTNGIEIYAYGKKDGKRFCGYEEYGLYSDACIWAYQLSTNKYPYIIDIEYTMEYYSLFFWPRWSPQGSIPVEHSKYQLTVHAAFNFDTREYGLITPPSIIEKGHKKIYCWELNDIPAFELDDYAFYLGNERMLVKFSPHEFWLEDYSFDGGSWTELGKGNYEMAKRSFVFDKKNNSFINELQKDVDSQLHFCRRLHEALSKKMRYVAVETGIGGWQPSKCKDTFERGYGDCKDLSTLYAYMLQDAGIKAKTALILTRDKGQIDPDFPELWFNHVILLAIADNDTIWIDPTCQQCPIDDLPWLDEDVYVLVSDWAGGQLIKTPVSTPKDNSISRKTTIELSRDKSADVCLEYMIEGNPSHFLKSRLLHGKKHKLDEYLKHSRYGLTDKVRVDSVVIGNEDRSFSGVIAKLFGTVKKATYSVGKKQYLDLSFLSMYRRCELVDMSDRTQALDLDYPICYLDTMIIKIPEGWTPLELPIDTVINDEFGSLTIDHVVQDNQVVIFQERQSYNYRITPEQFADFETHISSLTKASIEYLSFTKQ